MAIQEVLVESSASSSSSSSSTGSSPSIPSSTEEAMRKEATTTTIATDATGTSIETISAAAPGRTISSVSSETAAAVSDEAEDDDDCIGGVYVEDMCSQSISSVSTITPENPLFGSHNVFSSSKSYKSPLRVDKGNNSPIIDKTNNGNANRGTADVPSITHKREHAHRGDNDDGVEETKVSASPKDGTHSRLLMSSVTTTDLQQGQHKLVLEALPDSFHRSPEPVPLHPEKHTGAHHYQIQSSYSQVPLNDSSDVLLHQQHHLHHHQDFPPPAPSNLPHRSSSAGLADHHYHLLRKIREDQVSDDGDDDDNGETSMAALSTKETTAAAAAAAVSSPVRTTYSSFFISSTEPSGATSKDGSPPTSPLRRSPPLSQAHHHATNNSSTYFEPYYMSTKLIYSISLRIFQHEECAVATWIGFWALLNVTCANYVLSPMRDAVALQVGVQHIPKLTLASSVLAFLSSVPIGWLFEAPDPNRRKVWKKMGLTRGETQGTSLALFYRFFALSVLSYAIGFQLVDWIHNGTLLSLISFVVPSAWLESLTNSTATTTAASAGATTTMGTETIWSFSAMKGLVFSTLSGWIPYILSQLGQFMYIAFFLVVHLMRLHSISLVWGVTTEAMEYEDVARKGQEQRHSNTAIVPKKKVKTRLQRLALVGFGGTLGGIWGSILASSMARILRLPGLLVVSAFLLEISAELSIELGRIMQKHWEEQQIFKSSQDLTSLDPSMKRSGSMGSMKRVASGNSLFAANNMRRSGSAHSMTQSSSARSLSELDNPDNNNKNLSQNGNGNESNSDAQSHPQQSAHAMNRTSSTGSGSSTNSNGSAVAATAATTDDNTFTQRLLRGIRTILRSRLLMAIFTYNALFSSTTVLLSFQRAELVANRNSSSQVNVSADTAFLANINIASSTAVFAMQASGLGAMLAQRFGSRGSLALMPIIRLLGVITLVWWHRSTNGKPPNLILFLVLDECTRVVNLAVAKPVRESLWRGLSNEARYEAKPIVDTLANRWGAGSASFCVSVVSKTLLWLGMASTTMTMTTSTEGRTASGEKGGEPHIFGLPPVLFLCLLVAAWWTVVSFDLGHIRKRIDMELKKHQ